MSYIDELRKKHNGVNSLQSLIDETNSHYSQEQKQGFNIEPTYTDIKSVLPLSMQKQIPTVSTVPTIPMKGASLPESNPVINKDLQDKLFLVNPFPIRKNDSVPMTALKGLGDFAFSLGSAPGELARKAAIQFGNIASGKGIATNLPKNTSFVSDILPKGAGDKLKEFEQSHPVAGGIGNMLLETAVDPATYITSNAVYRAFKPQTGFEQAAKNFNKVNFPELETLKPKQVTEDIAPTFAKSNLYKTANAAKEFPETTIDLDIPLKNGELDFANAKKTPRYADAKIESPLLKERKFAQNVRESQVSTPENIDFVNKNKELFHYEPISNEETISDAMARVTKDADAVKQSFYSVTSKGLTAEDTANVEALIMKANTEGNAAEANRLIADLAERATISGQGVQALKIFKRMTPEGMLYYARRTVNRINKELTDKLGNKAKKILLTDDDSEFILNKMNQIQTMPDGREKEIELAKILQLIADKEPPTIKDKILALQRQSLLLNPKTMVRNTLGNTIFGTLENTSNIIATPIDIATSKLLKTDKRTTTLPNLKEQFRSGVKGARETLEDYRLGIDTYPAKTQYELPNKTIFRGNNPVSKVLAKTDNLTKTGLQLGDRPFYQAAYDDSLRQQMKFAKVDVPTPEMIEQAKQMADYRTFQDANIFTEGFQKVRDFLNIVGVGEGKDRIGLGNAALPFIKTPANILARAIDYSPVGISKALKEATDIRKGTFNQKAFVDSISRSVTGTALIMVGYDLAKKGIITGVGNKDKDIAAFERNLGKSDYAWKVGDNYITYDWVQPASFGFAIGADIFLQGKDRKSAENVIIEAIKSGGETLWKQSVLRGLGNALGGYSPMENIQQVAMSVPTQFMPTFGKQIAQIIDPTQRSTYDPSQAKTVLNQMKAKIPLKSSSLEPSVNTFGQEKQNFQGNNNLFNIFLNPGYVTKYSPNADQQKILDIYHQTGDKDIFPKVAPKTITQNGEKITLTPAEITRFQKTMGSSISTGGDVKDIKKSIDDAYEKAKKELLLSRGIKIAEKVKLQTLGK